MKYSLFFILIFLHALFAEEKERKIVFMVNDLVALEDGSLWEVYAKEEKLSHFVSIQDKVLVDQRYEDEWKDRCFLDRNPFFLDLFTHKEKKTTLLMRFIGYVDLEKRKIVKLILDHRVFNEQEEVIGAFLELDGGQQFVSCYLLKERQPIPNWTNSDMLLLAYRGSRGTFLINLTRGDMIETYFIGILSDQKELQEVEAIDPQHLTLQPNRKLKIELSDGENLLHWKVGDEVIVRRLQEYGSSIAMDVEQKIAHSCFLLHNVSQNKVVVAREDDM